MKIKNKIKEIPWLEVLVLSILMLFIICFIPFLFVSFSIEDYSKTGNIGDTIGGITAPFISSIAAILVYIAFKEQVKANQQQRNDIKIERFESNFFNMLENHHRIIEAMDLATEHNIPYMGDNKVTYVLEKRTISTSRDCFKSIHKNFKQTLLEKRLLDGTLKNNEITLSYAINIYDNIQDLYKLDLHHYFRFIYHILKFVKTSRISKKDKYKYASILRGTMSAYELVLIYYNGLHDFGNIHFKPLIEEYSFLKNMDYSLLEHNIESIDYHYHPLAFAPSSERKRLYPKWLAEKSKLN